MWFVDSASTDGSAEVAAGLGAEVVTAPLGKGRAMARAIERCRTPFVCFMDGDLEASEHNMAALLRAALGARPPDMVVGAFDWVGRRFHSLTYGVYIPLVGALFPEAVGVAGRIPFSGFRVLRTDLELDRLPPGFAIETHLNLTAALLGWSVGHVELGSYEAVERPKPELGHEIGGAILDLAERHGRLAPGCRAAWEDWVARVVDVARECPPPGADPDDYVWRLAEVAARPLPAGAQAA